MEYGLSGYPTNEVIGNEIPAHIPAAGLLSNKQI